MIERMRWRMNATHAQAAPAHPAPGHHTTGSYVESQWADTINNAGRDQYIKYQYELRIEPMRRRAQALLRTGSVLVLSGLTAQFLAAVLFGSQIGDFVDSVKEAISAENTDPDLAWPPFEALLLIPVGAVVCLVGLAVILTSVSMNRRARREEAQVAAKSRAAADDTPPHPSPL
jgi:hypothetical protein